MSLSDKRMDANGKRELKLAFSNRGNPQEVKGPPKADSGPPNFFRSGTGPSKTLEPFSYPLTCIAANMQGSLNILG